MKVVILCGGQGTRIRSVAEDLPKPMVKVGNLPILWHIMKYYAHWNHNHFILCLGYKGDVIKDFFLNYQAHTSDFTISLANQREIDYHNSHSEADWKVTLAETGQESMTGARVRRIKKYVVGQENFMLTYGDGLGNVNLQDLAEFHVGHGKVMTVTGVRPPGRFGELVGNAKGEVVEFNEKPQATGGKISGGFFVCKREIFDYLGESDDLVLEDECMRSLVKDGQLMVYTHDGFWQCMDTYRDYLFLNTLYEQHQAPWMVWT